MQFTKEHVGKRFSVFPNWELRVILWEDDIYVRHEKGPFAGVIVRGIDFCWNEGDCKWLDDPSPLTRAVMVVRAAGELDLQFEDLTDKFWGWDDRDSLVFHETDVAILEDTGDYYHFEVRHKVEEDNNYIRFYIDNGCGDSYDVVFDKSKRLEVE